MTKNIIILSFIIFLTTIMLTGCGGEQEKIVDVQQQNIDETTQQDDVQKDFDQHFAEFNEIYKKALIATGEGDLKESQITAVQSAERWIELENIFLQNQPEEYAQTEQWDAEIEEICSLLQDTNMLIIEREDLEQAYRLLGLVRANFRDIRAENEHLLLMDYMLDFHDAMEVVIGDGEQKNQTHIIQMEKALVLLVEWDEFATNEEYQSLVNELNDVVRNVSKEQNQIFVDEVKKLKPTFNKLYMQFG